MHSYAALLGTQPAISTAELAATLPDFLPKQTYGQWITFESAAEIDQKFFDRLGGTVLIARRVIDESSIELNEIPTVLTAELASAKGKVTFGLRAFGIERSRVRELLKQCKHALKHRGVSSRYIGNESEPAKAIQLHDEGMLDPKKGCELVLLRDKHHFWIGRTVAAQNIKAYTKRDMDKPIRDTTVGLLPPKLAQILLNFGKFLASSKLKTQSSKLTIFDPFCGTGVIPLEAMLRGWNVLASDASLKAVNGCTKNIEWLRKTYGIAKKDVTAEVWKHDATKAFELKELPDVVVSETSLGPALEDRPSLKDAEKHMKEAEVLEANFLASAAKTLPGVPIVLTLPVWYSQKRPMLLTKVWDEMTLLGYRPVLPPHVDPSVPGRFSLLYRRNDQFVGREIVLLQSITKK